MTLLPPVERDERTTAIENASYRWSYLFLSFGLLLAVAYRSYSLGESPWDLLLLVIVGGGVGTAYQAYHGILGRSSTVAAFLTLLIAGLVAAAVVWLGR